MILVCPMPSCGVPLQPTPTGSIRAALTEHLELVHRMTPAGRAYVVSRTFHPAGGKL